MSSPLVPRPPKRTELREVVYNFEPQSDSQREAVRLWNKPTTRILLLDGPAGGGKTFCAVALALKEVLQGRAEQIVVTRPLVECGESLGFLPGDVNEKISPYLIPVVQVTKKIAFNVPDSVFVPIPLALLRGWTFQNQIAILDECQNVSRTQLIMFLSRMGKGSKIILAGDPYQSDIKSTVSGYGCDMDSVLDDLDGLPGVECVEFRDDECLRDPFLTSVLRRLS